MNKQKILELVDKYTLKIQEAIPTFKKPTVGFDKLKNKTAGQAYLVRNHLEFNLILAKDNPDEFENTVSHELAHLIVHKMYPYAKQHHGPEFKKVHKWLGGTGETYHKYNISNVKKRKKTLWVYKCKCKNHEVSSKLHSNITKGASYKCAKCNERITPYMEGNIHRVVSI